MVVEDLGVAVEVAAEAGVAGAAAVLEVAAEVDTRPLPSQETAPVIWPVITLAAVSCC